VTELMPMGKIGKRRFRDAYLAGELGGAEDSES